jgi:hypothetical protein
MILYVTLGVERVDIDMNVEIGKKYRVPTKTGDFFELTRALRLVVGRYFLLLLLFFYLFFLLLHIFKEKS